HITLWKKAPALKLLCLSTHMKCAPLKFCFCLVPSEMFNKMSARITSDCSCSLPEVPVKSVDLAAFNLTELVNGMLNTVLKGTKKFFSVLSITSYSSYAFHKVSIVLYNISNLKNVDPSKFPMRYCYCLNNRTNDLTDFTTLLVDIVGNSTDYLTEIFKSTSIVSVSQSNDTDCIYICVMSGRIGRNLSDLWEAIEKSPVINYTFSGNVSDLLGEYILNLLMKKNKNSVTVGAQLLLAIAILRGKPRTQGRWPQRTQVSLKPVCCVPLFESGDEEAVCSSFSSCIPELAEPQNFHSPETLLGIASLFSSLGCPQGVKKGSPLITLSSPIQTLKPCVMELCKFYQQCFCTRDRRYCMENYSWFLKNATYICEKVQRTAYSKSKLISHIVWTFLNPFFVFSRSTVNMSQSRCNPSFPLI
uniref:HERV-H LTR-associating 1 n=1 Tax=Varanus komodoensis TaxID=61221 RepID=A0A8D2J0S7_VARKO